MDALGHVECAPSPSLIKRKGKDTEERCRRTPIAHQPSKKNALRLSSFHSNPFVFLLKFLSIHNSFQIKPFLIILVCKIMTKKIFRFFCKLFPLKFANKN